MNQTRQAVIAFHVAQALRLGHTMRSLTHDIVKRYLDCTPLAQREINFQQSPDPYTDERHNTQIIDRFLDGRVRMPVDIEEAIVLALPERARDECLRELAARFGLMAAKLPIDDGARADVCTADLLRETGELLTSLAPALADGKLSMEDRPHLERAARECLDVMARVTTLHQSIVGKLCSLQVQPPKLRTVA